MKRLITFVLIGLSCICYANQEKPIVVVIPSYNNAQWYERNLNSVCFQNYNNYHIIYIDDCSPDGTGNLVRAYIAKHKLENKVTLICNDKNCGAMANHYKAVWMCADDVIIVHLDGDDFLKHNNVLARINREYQNPDVWMTYGQFERFPSRVIGFCRAMPASIIQRNTFREYAWITSHLRTFYAGLFKQIKLRDFVYDDKYYDITCDLAMMFPLLELAGAHIRFIPDVLYVYNEATTINDCKKNLIGQLHCEKEIRSKKKYKPASTYMATKCVESPIDMLFFSSDPEVVDVLLSRMHDLCDTLNSLTIFYPEEKSSAFAPLAIIYDDIPGIAFISEQNLKKFFDTMATQAGYFVFANDTLAWNQPLLFKQAVTALEATRAISFNFALGEDSIRTPLLERLQKQPSFIKTPHGCYAWQFARAEYDWRQPFAWTMNLCRKSDIAALLVGAQFKTVYELQLVLQYACVDLEDMGLCYPQAKVATL